MAKRSLSYGLLVVCVLLIAGPGYGLYVLYPRFDLPVVIGLPLVLLAGGAGLASFFSPCSFPLLLTFLAQEPGDEEPGRARWRLAGGLATGAALFLLLLGGSFAVGGMALSKTVTFGSTTGIVLRLITGGTLIGLGLVQAGWVSDRPFRWVERQVAFAPADGNERLSFRALVLFGFGYVLAGFG